MSTRLAQVGVRGFGEEHLERIDRLCELGRCELVAIADPAGPLASRDVPWYASLAELLASERVDVVSIATPIDTHVPLAIAALEAGCDVFLEKPPTPSLTDFRMLQDAADAAGRVVQVGFQSLGSDGVSRMRDIAGQLGELVSVQAWGVWERKVSYYRRAPWAGRRSLDGRRVADGVMTNPLAHSIATACAIVGLASLGDIVRIETEMYHAHDIEADDTSWARITRTSGVPIDIALTLCGEGNRPPEVRLVGTQGVARFEYNRDVIVHHGVSERVGRTCLLENLLDHRDAGAPLIVPLASTIGFTALLEATQDRRDPVAITTGVEWLGGDDPHPVLRDVDHWVEAALVHGGYCAAAAPWASPEALSVWRP